jgi:hypothetical protein
MRKYLFLISLFFPFLCSCSYIDDYRNRKFLEGQGIACEGFFAEKQNPIYKEYYEVSCKNGTTAIIDKSTSWVLASEEKISNERLEDEQVVVFFNSQNIKCDGIKNRKLVDEEKQLYKFICNNGNSGKFKYDEQTKQWAYVPLGAFLGFLNGIWESRHTAIGIIILIISLLPIVFVAFRSGWPLGSVGVMLIWFYIHSLYVIPYMSGLYDGIESSIARFFAAIGLILLGLALYYMPPLLIFADEFGNVDFADAVEDYWKSLVAQPIIYILGFAIVGDWKIALIIGGIVIVVAIVKWRIKAAEEAKIARAEEEEDARIKKDEQRSKQKEANKAAKKKKEEAKIAQKKEERKTLIKSTSESDKFYKIGNQKRREYSTDAQGNKHGQEKVYYRNGKLNKVQNWQNGILHGEAITYYPDGSVVYIKANYENGNLVEQNIFN